MKHKIWKTIGYVAYWVLMPLIYVYARVTKPRSRVLIIHERSVLVVTNWLGAGSWALPGGGLERGETALAAAVREVKEELSITLHPDELTDLGEHLSTERGGLRTKYYLYAVEVSQRPKVTLQPYEIMGYAWVPIGELQQATKGTGSTVKDSLGVWSSQQNLV